MDPKMKHHVPTILCLLGALLCYLVGMMSGAATFFAAGFVFEAVFWVRFLRRLRAGRA